jgi:hypothetical protein
LAISSAPSDPGQHPGRKLDGLMAISAAPPHPGIHPERRRDELGAISAAPPDPGQHPGRRMDELVAILAAPKTLGNIQVESWMDNQATSSDPLQHSGRKLSGPPFSSFRPRI